MYFPPLAADAINITSALTPMSQAIAAGSVVVLAVGLVLALHGLTGRKLRMEPSPWLVVLSLALFVLGVVTESAVNARFSATSLIYGTEGPPFALVGSWPMVGLAGDATALLGLLTLAATATVATLRLRVHRRPS